jgi:hypothetical protein
LPSIKAPTARATKEFVDPRPIELLRALKGLSTPSYAEKLAVWSNMSIPQAGIHAKDGGYQPFRIMDQVHQHPALALLVAGGIRASKSIGISAEAVAWSRHSDLIWIAADTYDLTRQEIEYTLEALMSLGWTKKSLVSLPRSRYQPATIETLWGTLIETRSLHDVNTFVARAPDYIAICEPGLADPNSVQKAFERLSTRAGRLHMAGTFEEARFNWMEEYWRKWMHWPNPESGKSFTVPTWVNRVVYPAGKKDPAILRLMANARSYEDFLLRCGGVPVPHQSQVIGDLFNEKVHVRPTEFRMRDEEGVIHPVELAIDPGFGGGSVYWIGAIQNVPDMPDVIRIVDEVSMESTVYKGVIEECRTRPWWPFARTGVIDPYAGGSHIFGAPSPQSVWWEQASVTLRMPERLHVDMLVGVLKDVLKDPASKKPHVIIDPKCERLIWELTHWRRKKDSAGGFGKPSDKNCDACKGLGYYASDWMSKQGKVSIIPPIEIQDLRLGF